MSPFLHVSFFLKRMFLSFLTQHPCALICSLPLWKLPFLASPEPLPLGVLLSGALLNLESSTAFSSYPIFLVMVCANTQALFPCIFLRALLINCFLPSTEDSSKGVTFSPTVPLPRAPVPSLLKLSTRCFHAHLPGCALIHQIQETVFLPSVLRSASSLTFNSLSHPDLASHASWTGLSHIPKSRLKIRSPCLLQNVSPVSLLLNSVCHPPQLPYLTTSQPLILVCPHIPPSLSIPLDFPLDHLLPFQSPQCLLTSYSVQASVG